MFDDGQAATELKAKERKQFLLRISGLMLHMFGKMVKTMSRYSVNHKAAQRIREKKRLILGIFPQKWQSG